jgi:hypothetical protein
MQEHIIQWQRRAVGEQGLGHRRRHREQDQGDGVVNADHCQQGGSQCAGGPLFLDDHDGRCRGGGRRDRAQDQGQGPVAAEPHHASGDKDHRSSRLQQNDRHHRACDPAQVLPQQLAADGEGDHGQSQIGDYVQAF